MFSLFRKELRHVKLLKYRNTESLILRSYTQKATVTVSHSKTICYDLSHTVFYSFLEAFGNLTVHTFQSQRHSRLLTEFGTHSVACPLFSSRVDTCKCWKWHWYVCFPVKCKECVKCRSGESFRLSFFFFFFTLEWKNTPVCVWVETLTAWFIWFYDCSSRALKRPQGHTRNVHADAHTHAQAQYSHS